MSKTAIISARIAILERELGKSGNQLGLDSGVGNGTVGGWTDNLIGKPSLAVKQFLRHFKIRDEWWKTGEGDIFHTSVQNQSDNTEIPKWVTLDEESKKLFEVASKTTRYTFIPTTILEGEYRIELKSELEQRNKERDQEREERRKAQEDALAGYKKLVDRLEAEIAELRSGKIPIAAPQNTK